MTAVPEHQSRTVQPELRPRARKLTPAHMLLGAAGLLVLLSLVRVLTGADDITSAGTTSAALGLAVPIGMAGMGALWAERAGIVNIGLEGMLILGTWGAGYAGYLYGPWAGVGLAVAMGAAGGLIHAVATVSFGVDHVVSGVAVILLGTGTAQYLSSVAYEGVPGGGDTQSPPIDNLPVLSVPGVGGPLGDLEARGWFLVSDVAGILRGVLTATSVLTLIAIALVVLTWFVLWRTAFGLRLRACGERPEAAESLGVNVYTMKYVAVVVSGAFAGFGGAFLAIAAASAYREGQTGGRGFIGIAAMIFGNWRPGGTAAGAALFGYADALQLRRGGESVHALLLLLGVVLVAFGIWLILRGSRRGGITGLVVAVAVLTWFSLVDAVPGELTGLTPYVATLLVLGLAAQRLRPPAANGLSYRKGTSA
ncbi:MAG TPA: ABC transporter permease [Mycobacteriales bacterium]|nr:ABC transporter permease [Mycobacteriales bacterium]